MNGFATHSKERHVQQKRSQCSLFSGLKPMERESPRRVNLGNHAQQFVNEFGGHGRSRDLGWQRIPWSQGQRAKHAHDVGRVVRGCECVFRSLAARETKELLGRPVLCGEEAHCVLEIREDANPNVAAGFHAAEVSGQAISTSAAKS